MVDEVICSHESHFAYLWPHLFLLLIHITSEDMVKTLQADAWNDALFVWYTKVTIYLISDMMHTSNKEKAAKSALVGVSRIHLSLLQVATYSIVLFYFMHSVGHCCLEGAVVCTLYCLCKYYLFLIHAFHNFFNLYHRCWHTYVCMNKQCDKKGK